jgi:hypothetical protein
LIPAEDSPFFGRQCHLSFPILTLPVPCHLFLRENQDAGIEMTTRRPGTRPSHQTQWKKPTPGFGVSLKQTSCNSSEAIPQVGEQIRPDTTRLLCQVESVTYWLIGWFFTPYDSSCFTTLTFLN